MIVTPSGDTEWIVSNEYGEVGRVARFLEPHDEGFKVTYTTSAMWAFHDTLTSAVRELEQAYEWANGVN